MWKSDITENTDIPKEYKKVIQKAKKQTDNNLYLLIQLCFSAVILIFSITVKNGNKELFNYVKDGYSQFFETENYLESSFSFNTFLEKMESELENRFDNLITVFNSRGSADIYPDNVSTDKIYIKNKGKAVAQGYISSPFGIRSNPFNNKEKEFHTGIDIAAPKGTFIRAAFDGEVIVSDNSDIAGNYIRIQSDGNIVTMYAHNQFNFVKAGDKVLAGQVIATMGRTGRATGPHIHFEFIKDGIRYNPAYILEI